MAGPQSDPAAGHAKHAVKEHKPADQHCDVSPHMSDPTAGTKTAKSKKKKKKNRWIFGKGSETNNLYIGIGSLQNLAYCPEFCQSYSKVLSENFTEETRTKFPTDVRVLGSLILWYDCLFMVGWRKRLGLDVGLGGSSWILEQVKELRAGNYQPQGRDSEDGGSLHGNWPQGAKSQGSDNSAVGSPELAIRHHEIWLIRLYGCGYSYTVGQSARAYF